MTQATIDGLLAARQAHRIGNPGSPARARARLDLNRYLWNRYGAFSGLRGALASSQIRFGRISGEARRVVRRLEAAGIIVPQHDAHRVRSRRARRYITGGWLEELAYCAMLEAGAEEAYYAQEIGWSVGDVRGKSEIDVIARRGDVLSFVSCKTASPFMGKDRRGAERLESQILETHYWDEHFANGEGRAVLLITTDMIDEARGRARNATLLARASVLDVDVVGRDFFTWDRLVAVMREHW